MSGPVSGPVSGPAADAHSEFLRGLVECADTGSVVSGLCGRSRACIVPGAPLPRRWLCSRRRRRCSWPASGPPPPPPLLARSSRAFLRAALPSRPFMRRRADPPGRFLPRRGSRERAVLQTGPVRRAGCGGQGDRAAAQAIGDPGASAAPRTLALASPLPRHRASCALTTVAVAVAAVSGRAGRGGRLH